MDAVKESLAKLEIDGYYQPIGGTVDRMYEIAAGMAEDLDGVEVQFSASIPVKDVVKDNNGRLAVNINSEVSGLNAHPKWKWPSVISNMIRKKLAGKLIVAVDGDIISVTRRGAKEVSYGSDTRNLREEAKKQNDYSKVDQKMITAEHAATIIALSRYSGWGHNTKEPSDVFKKDGLNYRTVEMFIDGEPYMATVVTAINGDPSQFEDYGEKFYDIESIEKQTNHPAANGTANSAATPHLIKTADSSSDRLTITQKRRIVNNQNAAYSTGDSATNSAFAEA